jgi:arylsulfatase
VEGESLLPVIEGREWARERPIFWEHEGNRAVRIGRWKLVSEYPGPWELYDIEADRTELHDLAGTERQRARTMARAYDEFAERAGVRVWGELFDGIGRNTRGRRDHVVGG